MSIFFFLYTRSVKKIQDLYLLHFYYSFSKEVAQKKKIQINHKAAGFAAIP